MPVDYESHRFPTNFIRSDENIIQNGSLALASTIHTIVENQHWNVLGDTPFITFLTRGSQLGSVADVTTSLDVTVMLPPFATHVAFYFYYAHDFDSSGVGTTAEYIDVSSSVDSSRATNLPFGEDLTDTSKPSLGFASGGWVFFDGIVPNPTDTTPQAIAVVSAMSGTWQEVTVTVDTSNNIALLSGAYRVLPNRNTFEVDV